MSTSHNILTHFYYKVSNAEIGVFSFQGTLLSQYQNYFCYTNFNEVPNSSDQV